MKSTRLTLSFSADTKAVDFASGLAGLGARSRKSDFDELVLLQALSAPPDGSTASFGRTAAMVCEGSEPKLRCPKARRAVGAEKGRAKQGERKRSRNEGGLEGA